MQPGTVCYILPFKNENHLLMTKVFTSGTDNPGGSFNNMSVTSGSDLLQVNPPTYCSRNAKAGRSGVASVLSSSVFQSRPENEK